MSAEINVSNEAAAELPIIAGKELWRSTYAVLVLFAVVGLMTMLFQRELEQLLGDQRDAAILTVAALILIVTHMNLIRIASRRVNCSKQAAMMIDSHLLLDEAIGVQLKGVLGDTENAAVMLIMEVNKLSDAAKVVEFMRSQQESHEDIRGYYQAMFSVMTEHNTVIAAGIAEIAGHIQFQDVVRQRIERIEDAIAKRNLLFLAFCQRMVTPDAELLDLPMQMRMVLDEYLSIESRHAPISNDTEGQGAGMTKFELF